MGALPAAREAQAYLVHGAAGVWTAAGQAARQRGESRGGRSGTTVCDQRRREKGSGTPVEPQGSCGRAVAASKQAAKDEFLAKRWR